MVSCWKYRDAWKPFIELFNRFWPDCPYGLTVATDELSGDDFPEIDNNQPRICRTVGPGSSWCEIVATVAKESDEPILLMQEDFFLNAPVQQGVVEKALQMVESQKASMVRLYPCPGAAQDSGDPHFGIIPPGTRYRISCQASIWEPIYLRRIAQPFGSPAEFEIDGTAWADHLPDEVFAFKRDVQPWPLNYLCSAIGRGLWSQDAKRLCDEHNIEVDWSLRGFQPA